MYSGVTPSSREEAHKHHILAHSMLSLGHMSKVSTGSRSFLPKALCPLFEERHRGAFPAQGVIREHPVNSRGEQDAPGKSEVKKEPRSPWGKGIHVLHLLHPTMTVSSPNPRPGCAIIMDRLWTDDFF